ncbi:MAG: dienelactone hydrolase family protein, partial [Pseudonocardiaceae bacterium]
QGAELIWGLLMLERRWLPANWWRGEHRGYAYYVVGERPNGVPRPTVLLLHELNGISPDLVEWANKLAGSFRVMVPALLHPEGRPGMLRGVIAICVRREIHTFAIGRTSPVVGRLRALAEDTVPRGESFGVIGMCMSGGFALALAVNPQVRAAVVAQPSLPTVTAPIVHLPLPGAAHRASDLGLDPADVDMLRRRAADAETDGSLAVRAFRFRDDSLSPPERLDAACNLLGTRVLRVRTLCEPDPSKHSTLTGQHASHEAVTEVIEFLKERLSLRPG